MVPVFKRRLLAVVGAAAVVAAAAAAVFWVYRQADRARDLSDPARARRENRPIPVRTARVGETQAEMVVGGTVVTAPSQTVLLRAGLGRIKLSDPTAEIVVGAVHAVEGNAVRRGQLLFELQDRAARQIVKHREAALTAALAELERVRQVVAVNRKLRQLEVTSAEAEVKFRADELKSRQAAHKAVEGYQSKGAVNVLETFEIAARHTEAAFRQAEAGRRLERAKDMLTAGAAGDQAELSRAESQAEMARIDLEAAQHNLEDFRVCSPLDGFVARVEADPGQTVSGGGALARLVKLDPLHVRMDCPVDSAGEVAIGQKAEVVLDGFRQESFSGTVVRISPEANPELRVLPVVIEVANPRGRLRAGMTGFARLQNSRRAPAVPSLAVMRQGDRAVVFRVEDGRARVREVRLGPVVGPETVEVNHGLSPGDEVIVFNNFYATTGELTSNNCYVQDNDPVDADWRKWTRRE